MKLRILGSFATLFFVMLLLQSASGGRAANGEMDRTGAPGSGGNCMVYCHQGSAVFTNPEINFVIKDGTGTAVTSYIPGATYTIEATVTSDGTATGYGMQAVFLDTMANNSGDFVSATTPNSQLVTISNGREFLEHQGMSASGLFSATWQAPAAGTGNVTLYGIGLVVNGDGALSGDAATPTAQLNLTENSGTPITRIESMNNLFEIYPMPNNGQFNIKNNGKTVDLSTRIIDAKGAVLYAKDSWINENAVESFDVQNLPDGLYFMEFKTKEGVQTKSLLIRS